jgi:hypothetical protein
MRFRPAPLSFWANVITVGIFVPPIVFLWIGLVHSSSLAILFYALAAIWAVLVFVCWAISTREYKLDGSTLVIVPRLGANKSYEILGVDEVAMKRQPLRRAFAFQAIGAYGPFGFHGQYRAIVTRPAETPGGRSRRRQEQFHVACTTLQKAIYLQTKSGAVVISPREMPEMLQACGGVAGEVRGEGER